MKKNKKYWKEEATIYGELYLEAEYIIENFENRLGILAEDYNNLNSDYFNLDALYMDLIDKYEDQKLQLEAAKRDLNLLRQYNIGKKSADFDNYKVKQIVMKSSVPPSNTTSTSGSGYFYNTTFDFTKPKKKTWWKRNK